MIRLSALCLSACAAFAAADPVVLTIDPDQSSIIVEATLMTAVGDDTDTAVSSISGTIEIELDHYGSPTAISLFDFIIVLDDDITLDFNYGFLGSATATLTDAIAMYATPGLPQGPVPVAGSFFSFPDVPAVLSGEATGSYDFFLVGSDTIQTDLADLGVFLAPISGLVTTDGTTVTVEGTFEFDVTETIEEGVADLRLVGTATIVATGQAPEPGGCNPADLAEPFGVLDLADISAFVTAFVNQDPAADLAPPFGVLDLADISAFVTAFQAGCP